MSKSSKAVKGNKAVSEVKAAFQPSQFQVTEATEAQKAVSLQLIEEKAKLLTLSEADIQAYNKALQYQEGGKTAKEKAEERNHIISLTLPFKGFTKVGKGQGISVTIAGRDFKISSIHYSKARVEQQEKGQTITFNYSIKDFQNRERKEYSQKKSTHYPTPENNNSLYTRESIGYKEIKTA